MCTDAPLDLVARLAEIATSGSFRYWAIMGKIFDKKPLALEYIEEIKMYARFCYFFVISIFLLISSTQTYAHSWEAPGIEAQRKNPITSNLASVNEGKNIFIKNCAKCHGNNAEGLKATETGLNKNTGNLKKRLKGHSEGDFFWKIQNGKGEMPSFVDKLSQTQIWHVINYIKSLSNNNK